MNGELWTVDRQRKRKMPGRYKQKKKETNKHAQRNGEKVKGKRSKHQLNSEFSRNFTFWSWAAAYVRECFFQLNVVDAGKSRLTHKTCQDEEMPIIKTPTYEIIVFTYVQKARRIKVKDRSIL